MHLTKILSGTLRRGRFILQKHFSTRNKPYISICVIGAAGGIGSALSLLLKLQPHLVSEIRMQDIDKSMLGIAMDLSHINTPVTVQGYTGGSQLKDALKGADVVVITGGISKVPVMTRENLLAPNAIIMRDLAIACSELCPNAIIDIVTNPVNSCLPIFCETMGRLGTLNPTKVIGVTTLDVTRIQTFIANMKGLDPRQVTCPVIGGHSLVTMIPLLSQCKPHINFSENETEALFNKIRTAGDEVMKAKRGNGTAQLSMAYSAAYFIFEQLKAMTGKPDVVQCGYSMNNIHKTEYFSSKLLLGKDGIIKDLGLGKLSNFEKEKLNEAIPLILKDVETGRKFLKER